MSFHLSCSRNVEGLSDWLFSKNNKTHGGSTTSIYTPWFKIQFGWHKTPV